MLPAVKLMADDDAAFTVGGYGVVWGGRDISGERFEPDTDFWFDRLTETPMVLWQHGADDALKRSVIGRVSAKTPDDVGLWIEAQIEKAGEYAAAVQDLVKRGLLGWSSGAVAHLAQVNPDGKIVSWPVAEFSLTPTPCEPRTIGVQELKALAEVEPALKAVSIEPTAEPAAKALPTAIPVDGEGSYERLTCDIQQAFVVWMLGQGLMDPSDAEDYTWRWHVAHTYPEFAVLSGWGGHDFDSYQVGYVVDAAGAVTITEVREVEQVYLATISLDQQAAPLGMMAAKLTEYLGTLAERTKDVRQSRAKEGRVLSTGNRDRLSATADAMRAALAEIDDLLAATEPQPAKAASVDRARLALQLELLRLTA